MLARAQDMRDASMVILYKGKRGRGDRNSIGISVLNVVGKLIGRIVLRKLQRLADRIYFETQYGFQTGQSTIDMIRRRE